MVEIMNITTLPRAGQTIAMPGYPKGYPALMLYEKK